MTRETVSSGSFGQVTCLESVRLHGSSDPLILAYPEGDSTSGCLNVICGPNNVGKSFLLERVWRILKDHWHDGILAQNLDIQLACTGKDKPLTLYFAKAPWEKTKAGTVGEATSRPGSRLVCRAQILHPQVHGRKTRHQ